MERAIGTPDARLHSLQGVRTWKQSTPLSGVVTLLEHTVNTYLAFTAYSILALGLFATYRRGTMRLCYGAALWLALSAVVATAVSSAQVAWFLGNLSFALLLALTTVRIRRSADRNASGPTALWSRISTLQRAAPLAFLVVALSALWAGVSGAFCASMEVRASDILDGLIVLAGLLWFVRPTLCARTART